MRSQTRSGAKSLTKTYNKPYSTVARGVKGGDESRSPKLKRTHKESKSLIREILLITSGKSQAFDGPLS